MNPRQKTLFALWTALFASGISWATSEVSQPETPTARVEIRATFEAPTKTDLVGSWVLRRIDREQNPIEVPLAATGPTVVLVPTPSSWEIALKAEGFWAPRKVVQLESSVSAGSLGHGVEVSVWPLGRIAGVLKAPKPTDRLPEWFEAQILVPPQPTSPRTPEARTGCWVDADQKSRSASFLCLLPVGSFDLAFYSADYAPFYRRVTVPAAGSVDLGTQTLQQGGSLLGWAALEGAKIVPDKGRVALLPFLAQGGETEIRRNLERRGSSQVLRPDGAIRWTGLAPGIYRLVVEHEGYAPFSLGPLDVQAGREILLREPLVLRRPLDLALTISPAVDGYGRPWRVELLAHAVAGLEKRLTFAVDRETDAEGRLLARNLTPGRYGLTIVDSSGSHFHDDLNFVLEGVERMESAIALDLWTLSGSIRLGGEPVAAEIYFGGRFGSERVRFDADPEGTFQGVLPRVGLWRVEIVLAGSGGENALVQQVRVRPKGGQEAEVEISLADTRLAGRVVERDGKAAAGADVSIDVQGSSVRLSADSKGKFELRGLPEGPLFVGASVGQGDSFRSSAPQEVNLRARTAPSDGDAAADVELVLETGVPWKGRVDSPNGPFAGARVLVFPTTPDQGFGASARTDDAGEFRVALSPRAQSAYVVLAAPGYGLAVVPWRREGGPLVVSPEQGSLEIVSPTPWNTLETSQRVEIFQDGRPLPMSSLVGWMQVFGQNPSSKTTSRTFPSLKPGHYALCVGPAPNSLGLSLTDWAATRARCNTGQLPQGGALSLSLPRLED